MNIKTEILIFVYACVFSYIMVFLHYNKYSRQNRPMYKSKYIKFGFVFFIISVIQAQDIIRAITIQQSPHLNFLNGGLWRFFIKPVATPMVILIIPAIIAICFNRKAKEGKVR